MTNWNMPAKTQNEAALIKHSDMEISEFKNVCEWKDISLKGGKYVWGFNYASLAEQLTRLQQHII